MNFLKIYKKNYFYFNIIIKKINKKNYNKKNYNNKKSNSKLTVLLKFQH